VQRFRCAACGKTCSTQTFSVHYWTHRTTDMLWLLQRLAGCGGLRQTARFAGVGYRFIQNRVRRLARNALAVMDEALHEHALREDVAMDGFESYTRSRYHPNNLTLLVGATSQFIYGVVHTLLRRKGSMSEAQRRTRARIDTVWRPPRTLGHDCRVLLRDLSPLIVAGCKRRTITLSTDRHRAYPAALRGVAPLAQALRAHRLIHQRISSRAARTTRNPLFPVNYVDRQIRMNMAEHVRRTMRGGREVNCQMERMALFMVVHNYLTPHRVGDRVHPSRAYTHAAQAALQGRRVRWMLERLTTARHVFSHCRAEQAWIRRIWKHAYENPPVVRMRGCRSVARSAALPPGALPRHLVV
jgi:hypothetical protein